MDESGAVAIRAGWVFPATDETVLRDAWVLVEDGRIAEVTSMVETGLPPTAGLLAATRNGADPLGILDQTGTLEAGKQADLLLVRGDAIDDGRAIRADGGPLAVFKGGRAIRA